MTRQIAAITSGKRHIGFHITSLTPLRPENKPYPWEIPWLESFALGSTEKSTFAVEKWKENISLHGPSPPTPIPAIPAT